MKKTNKNQNTKPKQAQSFRRNCNGAVYQCVKHHSILCLVNFEFFQTKNPNGNSRYFLFKSYKPKEKF